LSALARLNRLGRIGLAILALFGLMALAGPSIAPYDPRATQVDAKGEMITLSPPSWRHPLGTTWQGRDVLSQVLHGARPTLAVGLSAALILAFLGVNVGLWSGYFGGWVDLVLMRAVDILYGLPFLPLMVVVMSLLAREQKYVILGIGLVAWRDVARVVRARTLSLREEAYIKAVRSMGAGHLRVIYLHLFPNLLPLALLFLAFGLVWSILGHADLSFLGFGDPQHPTWGDMVSAAWAAGVMSEAYWWYLAPSVCIASVSTGAFFLARALEEVADPRLRRGGPGA